MPNAYTLFQSSYHRKLIEIYIQTTVKTSLAMAALIILNLIALYKVIPDHLLVIWLSAQLIYLFLRIIASQQISKALLHDQKSVESWLKRVVFIVFLGAFLWCTILSIAVIYDAPIDRQFIILLTLAGIISGSIASLSAIFIIFRIYLITITLGIITSYLLMGGFTSYIIIFLTLTYAAILHSTAHTMYSHIKNSIETSESLHLTQQNLAALNTTLEHRINKEIENNKIYMNKMLHQSRLAQMGEMLSMIAHQWRQPLTAITTSIANIKLKTSLSPTVDASTIEKNISDIESYALHLSSTINDFRGFFKANKNKKKSSFKKIIDDTLKIIEASLQDHKITIETKILSEQKFYSYPNELKQVLLNLIKNAEDVLLEKDISKPHIVISTQSDDQHATLTVEDNAGGIDESIMSQIFDPYFTTKKHSDGTGLGLYMSKTIVEENCEGKLLVKNTLKGASFSIIIHINS